MFEQTLVDVLVRPLDTTYYDRLAAGAPVNELHAMVEKNPYTDAFLKTLFGYEWILCPVEQPPAPIPTLLARVRVALKNQSIYVIRATGWCVDMYKYWDAIRRIGHLEFMHLDDAMWLNHLLMRKALTDEVAATFQRVMQFTDVWSIYHEDPAIAYSLRLFRNMAPEIIEMKRYNNGLRLGDVVLFTSSTNHPFSIFPAPDHVPSIAV